jgi:hypothetical protein
MDVTSEASDGRKRSIIAETEDSQGRRKTIYLEHLNDADRALIEQFGYKPVSKASQDSPCISADKGT